MGCQNLSEGTYGVVKCSDIPLKKPIHVEGQATKAESGPHQVQKSGDVTIPYISTSRKHP